MSITIKEIAKLAQVSITTVSKVINGKDQDLSHSTIVRIKAIIDEHNYQPNVLAQSMRSKQMKLLGIMLPDIRNPFFTEIIRGSEDCANKYGYSLLLCLTDNDLDKELNYVRSLEARHIDGLVLSGLQIESRIKDNQVRLKIPFSFVSGDKRSQRKGQKYSLNHQGSQMATSHLLDLGHRNILYVGGPQFYIHSQQRFEGYAQALKDRGLPCDLHHVFYLKNYTAEAAIEEMSEVLKTTDATAIVCGNDLIAYGLLKLLHQMGKHVPSDMSVIGYDDIDMNQNMNPPLTSVNANRYALGWDTTLELIAKIEKRSLDDFIVDSEVSLSVRASCAAPKENA